MSITKEDLKELYGHDQFDVYPALGEVNRAVDEWLIRLIGWGINSKQVTTRLFDAVTTVAKMAPIPGVPVIPSIDVVYKHKKTGQIQAFTAFPPSHYPTAVTMVYMNENPT